MADGRRLTWLSLKEEAVGDLRLDDLHDETGRPTDSAGMTPQQMRVFRLPAAVKRDPQIARWMREQPEELRTIARRWFDVMRGCGDDVRELMHDGQPTACVGDAAFGYVDAFTSHVNVGFFGGAALLDPKGLLEGSGRFMRHVKLTPGRDVDAAAMKTLIEKAYADMKRARQSA